MPPYSFQILQHETQRQNVHQDLPAPRYVRPFVVYYKGVDKQEREVDSYGRIVPAHHNQIQEKQNGEKQH